MAAKLIANLIVLGSGVVLRAVSQAYRQALVNASKSGVAQETVQNMAHKVSKTMSEHEARQILGVTEKSSWEEIMKKYSTLFENNAKAGTFYVQSKVFQAKACLEAARQQASQGNGQLNLYCCCHSAEIFSRLTLCSLYMGCDPSPQEQQIKAIDYQKCARGTGYSVENMQQGFTHVLLSTFDSKEGHDEYLVHPHHEAYGKELLASREISCRLLQSCC